MNTHFSDFDHSAFWEDIEDDDEYESYASAVPNDKTLIKIEKSLGYRIPSSYIELMKNQNGGYPKNTCFPNKEIRVSIVKFYGIADLDPETKFMMDEWEYPDIGIYFADCPSAGHHLIGLDYRTCGRNGEPQVVHVDQEAGFKITLLAENFEAFILGLKPDED